MEENALDNIVCKMAAILSRPQCVQYFKITILNLYYDSDLLHGNAIQFCSWVIHVSRIIFVCVHWPIVSGAIRGVRDNTWTNVDTNLKRQIESLDLSELNGMWVNAFVQH